MKTKLLFAAVAFVAILAACKTAPKVEEAAAPVVDTLAAPNVDTAEHSRIIAAKIFIKADKVAEFTKMFQAMTDSTLKEPGCTGYQLYQNPYDKNSFLVFETYKNQAAIDAHFAAPYFKAFGDKVAPLTSKPTELVIYDVAGEKR